MKLQLKETEEGSWVVFCQETHSVLGGIYPRGYPGIHSWGLRVFEDDGGSRVFTYLDKESALQALKLKFNVEVKY